MRKLFYFDMDDTIYDMMMPFENAFREIFGYVHKDIAQLIIAHRKYSDEIFEASVMEGKISIEDMYIYRIQMACKDFGIEISKEDSLRFQEIYESYQMKIYLSDEMKEFFDHLKEMGNFGVITNGIADHQGKKIGVLGLEKWIPKERILISGEVGVAKPHVGIFRIAEERIGFTEGDEIYYLGDSADTDVFGGAKAGWKTVWFNRRNKPNNSGVTPDYTVHTEEELIALVKELEK